MASIREIIRAELPQMTYAGIWEYQTSSTTIIGGTVFIDGFATATIPLPDLVAIPLRPSIAGTTVVPAVGSKLLVAFVNQDPTRPFVLSMDALPPVAISLGGGATDLVPDTQEGNRVVRYGDQVFIPVSGSFAVGSIVQNPATAPNPISRLKA